VSSFNMWKHTIQVTDPTKTGLVKKVQNKEACGWECVKPLHTVQIKDGYMGGRNKDHPCYFSRTEFAVVMKKIGRVV